MTIWFNGLSGSGKTTLGKKIVEYYKNKNIYLLDGDILRKGLNFDLGFSIGDRNENLRRAAEVAKILNDNNIIVIATFITPTNDTRNIISKIIPNVKFIHLSTPLNVCETRDVKGLYLEARQGKIKNFTGIDSPFEDMPNAWLVINNENQTIDETFEIIKNRFETIL